jgi:anti-anti-sigma factor
MSPVTLEEPSGVVRLRADGDGVAVVQIDGPIDVTNAASVGALVDRGLATGQSVVIDLSEVPFIAAAGLTMLVSRLQTVGLSRMSAFIAREFRVTGLLPFVRICD